MFGTVVARVRTAVRRVLATVREVLRPAPIVTGFIRDGFRTHEALIAENAALRLQLIVAARKVKRPPLRPWERGVLVALASRLKNWRNTILLVKPDTILRWHREGFRLFWTRKSKAAQSREARIPSETIDLIRRMALDNRT